MRFVPIRQFQRSLYREIKELPVTVTRSGEPLFVVTTPKSADISPTEAKIPQIDPSWKGQCQAPNQYCKSFGKKYVVTFYNGEESEVVEQYLCDTHVVIAKQQAESVEEVLKK